MTNQVRRDSFIFYRSFFETIEDLDDKNQLEIYKAIAEYSLNDKLINLEGISKTIFRLIEPQLLANKKRFLNGKLGAPHGIKGGRPKTLRKPQENPKKTPNKNNNVNPNHNEELKSKLESLNVNLETWQDFVDFRKEIKKPITDRILKRILRDLEAFESKKGGYAHKALENSIRNSWQDVYEPKEKESNNLNLNQNKGAKLEDTAVFINNLINDTLIQKIELVGQNTAKLFLGDKTAYDKLVKISEDKKQEIKDYLKKELDINKIDFNY